MFQRPPREGLILYHFPASLCSQKVRLALAEKGVRYATRVVNIGPAHENYEPWYMRLNPRGVVPTLVHDGELGLAAARHHRHHPVALGEARHPRTEADHLARIHAYLRGKQPLPIIPAGVPNEVRRLAEMSRVNVLDLVISAVEDPMWEFCAGY